MKEKKDVIHIRDADEAAQLIPYLVGFTPEESLVVVALRHGRVEVTARVDLGDIAGEGAVEGLVDRIWTRFPNATGLALAYTADHETGWEALRRCSAALPGYCPTMLVDGNTWYLPDGTTGTTDPNGTVATAVIYSGLQRLDRRADLENRFVSPPESRELGEQLGAALASLPRSTNMSQFVAHAHELIQRNLPPAPRDDLDDIPRPGPAISTREAIQLMVLVQYPVVRQLALLCIDSESASRHLQLWQSVVQLSPAHGSSSPLFLAGMAGWISGDGASAAIALHRSLQSDSHARGTHPGRLLEGLIDHVVPPSAWNSMRDALLADADPLVRDALSTRRDHTTTRRWGPITSPGGGARPEQETRRPPAPGIAI